MGEMMSSDFSKIQSQIELYLNEQASDLMVFRVTLQAMFWTMLSTHPHKEEMLGGLKEFVLGSLGRTLPLVEDPQGGERRKQLTMVRAEQFFQEIEQALGIKPTTERGVKN